MADSALLESHNIICHGGEKLDALFLTFSVLKRKFVFIPAEFLFHEILHQAMRASRWLDGPLIFQIRNNLNFSGDSCCAEAREGVCA